MTLKKLFAASAGALLALQSFVPITALGNAVISAEIQEAYEFAYVNGITTQYPIENANVFGAITRAEMAKMIANWAEKTLGIEADTSISVNFTDTASVKGDLAEAIVRATQMGLMGQGITAFRPYDTVSRAEFGTLVSRAIFGSTNDGGVPYFAAHLAALKNAGIINIVPSDPENYTEIRGYVMIQLQRATEKLDTVSDKCDDPLVILACLMGDCPAECDDDDDDETEVVKSGDLALTAAASEDRRAIIN